MASIVSIGSGTIPLNRKSIYVNDSALTSGSVVSLTLADNMSDAAGGGGLKFIDFTTGSPASGNSFKVVLNNTCVKAVDFNYTIIQ